MTIIIKCKIVSINIQQEVLNEKKEILEIQNACGIYCGGDDI